MGRVRRRPQTRGETVLRWMQWFEQRNLVERYPAVAVHGALIFALLGRPIEAERWAAAAERAPATGTLPDGSTMASYLAYLRAILCRDGVDQMRRDAQIAGDGLSPRSPYRATMLHTEGVSYLLQGDPDRADPILAHAFDAATSFGAPPLAAVVLAERCIVAVSHDDWPAAEALAERGTLAPAGRTVRRLLNQRPGLRVAARTALHRGDVGQARAYVTRATHLRPLLTYALPVQALLELARVYIALTDPNGARTVLTQVHDILQQRPDLGVLSAEAAQLRANVDTMREMTMGASSLTTAELRLLPLLATHLSFRQIGERLYLSQHTVKSQALSVYASSASPRETRRSSERTDSACLQPRRRSSAAERAQGPPETDRGRSGGEFQPLSSRETLIASRGADLAPG